MVARQESDLVVVEGTRIINDALQSGGRLGVPTATTVFLVCFFIQPQLKIGEKA